jgi:hypothetical protein
MDSTSTAIELPLTGMTCANCANTIERILKAGVLACQMLNLRSNHPGPSLVRSVLRARGHGSQSRYKLYKSQLELTQGVSHNHDCPIDRACPMIASAAACSGRV